MDFNRVLLKVSGEAMAGRAGIGLDFESADMIGRQCLEGPRRGVQTAVVVGGGNFLRGADLTASGVDRVSADQMGMLATVINGLALRAVIENLGGEATVLSAVQVESGVELFDRRLCLKRLAKGHVVILVGGTGNPYFTTDTASALRASEINADCFFKATKVDGVYEEDPVKNPGAKRYDRLTHMEVIQKKLGVMDSTAAALCMENGIPIVVFSLLQEGSFGRILDGEPLGTIIS